MGVILGCVTIGFSYGYITSSLTESYALPLNTSTEGIVTNVTGSVTATYSLLRLCVNMRDINSVLSGGNPLIERYINIPNGLNPADEIIV